MFYNPSFFANPKEFMPERWLDKKLLKDAFTFTPFSAGARNCIG